jgi:hypothetical protein
MGTGRDVTGTQQIAKSCELPLPCHVACPGSWQNKPHPNHLQRFVSCALLADLCH